MSKTSAAVVLAAAVLTGSLPTMSVLGEPAVWTYTPGSPGTITDGNWTLRVSNPNDTARTLTLGNGTANNNIYVSGSGSLDLSDVVCRPSEGADYVITALTAKGWRFRDFLVKTAYTT